MVAEVGKRVAQVRMRSGVLVCLLSSHAFRVSRLIELTLAREPLLRFVRLPGIEFAFGWQSNLLHPS